jgi:phosphate transport system substrate-binding protein
MEMKNLKGLALTAMMSGLLVFTSGCGSSAEAGKSSGAGENNKQLSGEIKIDGSSTVYPIMEAVAEEYQMVQPDVRVSVGLSGTGGGFKAFIAGETDMSNASRPIKEEEKAQLEEKGIEYTELKLAFDGLSVIVNKENTWVDYLTIDELKKMWVEDGKVKKWSDIRKGWPEKEIKFFSPGTDSGTFDYFDEVILDEQPIVEKATLSEDDNILVQGIAGDKNGTGYMGYAYYLENKKNLKIVPIDGGKGPVEPTNETIESGEYAPLSRPLYTYVKNESVKKPEVYDYLKFVIDNAGDLSEEVGYVRLPEDEYKKGLDLIDAQKK